MRVLALTALAVLPAELAWSADLRERAGSIFGTLPATAENPANPTSPAKVELGRMLYYDARLSKNHDISCNSCHQLDRFGVDGEATSPGHRGQRGDRNSPTSLNAALHVAQLWDGRAADVEDQKLGLVHAYETEDTGRHKVSGSEADRFLFKVPSLRNVAKTGPWFHDGSIDSLEEAVPLMAWHQLGVKLSDAQVADVVAFLGSLTGEVDADYVAQPELPASGPATPKPDPS
jgi:cytochrome c peroxidase